MTFDIEKMKADGVEERLIDWIQMDTVSKLSLVARRLEQDALFKQFLQENEADIDRYAVSAGLLSKADKEWIADENNPYKSEEGNMATVTFKDCTEQGEWSIEVAVGESVTLPDINGGIATWYLGSDCSTVEQPGIGVSGAAYTVNEDITLYGFENESS